MSINSRVFLSSTIYDLIDVRAEIAETLQFMGFKPVLSDRPSSEFRVSGFKDSIETCLANVRSSAYVVVVLSRRYGPTLEKQGFEKKSATHLEYDEAVRNRIPILMFVRDKLEADHSLWSRNRNVRVRLTWVNRVQDYGLFDLLDTHKHFRKSQHRTNWYFTYRDSVDLKDILRSTFSERSNSILLHNLVRDSQCPEFRLSLESHDQQGDRRRKLRFLMENISSINALNLSARFSALQFSIGDEQYEYGNLGNHVNWPTNIYVSEEWDAAVIAKDKSAIIPIEIEYDIPQGIRVKDKYVFICNSIKPFKYQFIYLGKHSIGNSRFSIK